RPREERRSSRLFEKVVECLARARRRRRLRFAFDGDPRFKERAGVAAILGRDANRNGLLAVERRPRVEVQALGAGVQIRAAPAALTLRAPGQRDGQLVAAAPAPNHFAKAWHVEGLRRRGRLATRRVFLLPGR